MTIRMKVGRNSCAITNISAFRMQHRRNAHSRYRGLQIAITQKGYGKASTPSIAKAAGLSSGLIRYHFKSKQEILVALINSLNTAAQERFAAFQEKANTPTERPHAYIDAALALGAGIHYFKSLFYFLES